MSKFIKSPQFLLILFSVFFTALPFFWLHPGEIDLGGDSSRLYFYDPIAYLKAFGLYAVAPESVGEVQYNQYFLPFLLFLAGVKAIVHNSYLLVTIFNIFKLLGGFLAMYFVILEILNFSASEKYARDRLISQYAAIAGGVFYVLSPIVTGNWDKALTSHFQIALNPLMFFLLLKFFITHNFRYAWIGLLVSILFAPNFGLTSAPPFFAFYPLAMLFLILILKLHNMVFPSGKKIIIVIFFFIGLHIFHLIPQVINLFQPGSFTNTRVFDTTNIAQEGIRYFNAVLPLAKVSERVLLPSLDTALPFVYILVPLVIILGFVFNKKKQKTIFLISVFFLLTLYLLTANITQLGVKLYESFFYLPGFSMFRNFIGQWTMVYIFFYALLFGLSIKILFVRFSKLNYSYIVLGFGLLCICSSWRFISGDAITKGYVTNNVPISIQMDPYYERTLQYINGLPDDSKILMLPYSDAFYQVLAGTNGGAYVGPSTISYLTSKKTFTGYLTMTAPFSERFFKLTKEKDYEGIKELLAYFNVKYIFYNSDTRIYDSAFPGVPYLYTRESLPQTQRDYKEFVSRITGNKIFEKGTYQIFTVKQDEYLSLFYVAKAADFYTPVVKDGSIDNSSFLAKKNNEIRTVYFNIQDCKKLAQFNDCPQVKQTVTIPSISFERVNLTKYLVHVEKVENPYLLTFLNQYSSGWKIFLAENDIKPQNITKSYFDGEIQEGEHKDDFLDKPLETVRSKPIAESKHIIANGYANAWEIHPQDVGGRNNYTLIVEMTGQRNFYISLMVSSLVFLIFIGWGVKLFFPFRIVDIIRFIGA